MKRVSEWKRVLRLLEKVNAELVFCDALRYEVSARMASGRLTEDDAEQLTGELNEAGAR